MILEVAIMKIKFWAEPNFTEHFEPVTAARI